MFDPNLPAANSPNSSAEMRAQLNGLKTLIDAISAISAAVVDGVSTLDPGAPATVSITVSGNTLHFSFGIPRGQAGDQGPPGEVSSADLASAISGTSNNSNSVGTLGQGADPSYQQWQFQQALDKIDELINALRR